MTLVLLVQYTGILKTEHTINTPPTNPQYIASLPNDYDYTNPLLLQNNAFGNKYKYTNDVGEQFY